MKNLNPTSGLLQIVSGYLLLSRKIIVDLIRDKKMKPIELGYFTIFLISADWDDDTYRNGYIRHGLTELSTIWNIPYSTLYDYSKILVEKQLLIINRDTLQINNFEYFTSKGIQTIVKNKPTDEYLNSLLTKPFNTSEISENDSLFTNGNNKDTPPFSGSSKVEFDIYPRRVILKQKAKAEQEYEKIYKEDISPCLPPKDMRWIDENVEEKTEVENPEMEKDIIEKHFHGNLDKYKNSLSS